VDSRFGPQVEGVLHFVEGRRHTGFLEALVDEAQEFGLFSGQHGQFPRYSGLEGLAETNHEQTLSVRYVFRNHLIWRERAISSFERSPRHGGETSGRMHKA
jgi:hypothetical protein